MKHFVPRAKQSKKQRAAEEKARRVTWAFCPVTRKTDSKKTYRRKKIHPGDAARAEDYTE